MAVGTKLFSLQLFGLLVSSCVVIRCDQPCSVEYSIDITGGIINPDNSISYNGFTYAESQYFLQNDDADGLVTKRGCVCLVKSCIQKCCPAGQVYLNKNCSDIDDVKASVFSPTVYEDRNPTDLNAFESFFYFYGTRSCEKYLADEVYLQKNGSLLEKTIVGYSTHVIGVYCLDYFLENEADMSDPLLAALVCFPEPAVEASSETVLNKLYAVAQILSMVFMIVTLLVFILLPELRNLHGKCLMCYISGLIISFFLVAFLKFQTEMVNISMAGCITIAFVTYFFFMSSFFWMNAMCFDIWRTFSGFGGRGSNERRDLRRFIYYTIYSYGVPAVLVGIVAFLENHGSLPDNFVLPHFGLVKCWFYDWKGEFYYFFLPVMILVTVNVTLFCITSYKINTIQRETSILKGADSARNTQFNMDKQRFTMYVRLMVVMGVTWTLEIISFGIGGNNWLWAITDCANLFLGVYIFLVFVCKKKVWNSLTKRYPFFRRFSRKDNSNGTGRNAWTTRQSGQTEESRLTTTDSTAPVELQLKDIPTKN